MSAPRPCYTFVRFPSAQYENVDLSIQLKRPVFLVTDGQGTWEVTRLYVKDGVAKVDSRGNDRIGPERVVSVHWDGRDGLTIRTERYLIHAPADDVAGSVTIPG